MKRFRLCLGLVFLGAGRLAWADPTAQRWATSSLPVPYLVFAHASISGVADFQNSALPALRSAFARWTAASVSCTNWNSQYQGQFSSPADHTAISGDDHQNLVIWLGGSEWTQPSTALGVTTIWYRVSSGEIFDADMQLNNNFQWKVGGPDMTRVDVESIVTHEAGHFLGLAHSANPYAIMYGSYPIGAIKVQLTSDDINDVCTMYPSSATGRVQGDLCTLDSQCQSPLVCRRVHGASGSSICTAACTTDADCTRSGYTCQPADPAGMACLVPPGSPDLCRFCTGPSQCSNGICLRAGRSLFCSKSCQTDTDCGSAFQCASGTGSPDGGTRFCVPNAGTCPPPGQCSTSADCYQGFACVNTMCQATGNTGDHCEVSGYCSSCNLCVGDRTNAICRACCGGQGLGGRCNSCTSAPCVGGRCVALQSSTDLACIVDGGGGSPGGPGGGIFGSGGPATNKNGCGYSSGPASFAAIVMLLLVLAVRSPRRGK